MSGTELELWNKSILSRLPPLNAIKAFHAACRHLNFSRAAEELGVTQGAVSKQIIALEDFVGVKLFERHSNGLELTLEGVVLKRVTLPAFDLLLSGFANFRRSAPSSSNIRIAT
ncbi:MAG: LysR family transcriptional regulator [Henriciella sp.]|nr:LysR family transcriptional regulator [Henriciella sp.]